MLRNSKIPLLLCSLIRIVNIRKLKFSLFIFVSYHWRNGLHMPVNCIKGCMLHLCNISLANNMKQNVDLNSFQGLDNKSIESERHISGSCRHTCCLRVPWVTPIHKWFMRAPLPKVVFILRARWAHTNVRSDHAENDSNITPNVLFPRHSFYSTPTCPLSTYCSWITSKRVRELIAGAFPFSSRLMDR